ncbi:MAG: hypothetical protein GX958_05355 [Desulfitobacterium sp.]|nr:hypothetical protein [Desulfitobacterium sp.]
MLRLQIQTYTIRLEYQTRNSQLNMKTTLPKVEMERIPPQLEISQPKGVLTIDNSNYFHSVGRKSITTLIREFAQEGRQAALEAISKIVAKGDRLADLKAPGNTLGELAADSMVKKKGELAWTPIEAPIIRYEASPVETNFIKGTVNYTPHNAIIDSEYIPGRVDFQVTQYPRVEISVIDVEV